MMLTKLLLLFSKSKRSNRTQIMFNSRELFVCVCVTGLTESRTKLRAMQKKKRSNEIIEGMWNSNRRERERKKSKVLLFRVVVVVVTLTVTWGYSRFMGYMFVVCL